MKKAQADVREFHKAFEIYVNDSGPAVPDRKTCKLREELIHEELIELTLAMDNKDLLGCADAIGDLLYVVLGTAVSFGLDAEAIFNEVHRSNMTKVGGHKRADGKWIKPDSYDPPNMAKIIYGR